MDLSGQPRSRQTRKREKRVLKSDMRRMRAPSSPITRRDATGEQHGTIVERRIGAPALLPVILDHGGPLFREAPAMIDNATIKPVDVDDFENDRRTAP